MSPWTCRQASHPPTSCRTGSVSSLQFTPAASLGGTVTCTWRRLQSRTLCSGAPTRLLQRRATGCSLQAAVAVVAAGEGRDGRAAVALVWRRVLRGAGPLCSSSAAASASAISTAPAAVQERPLAPSTASRQRLRLSRNERVAVPAGVGRGPRGLAAPPCLLGRLVRRREPLPTGTNLCAETRGGRRGRWLGSVTGL